MSSGTSSGSFNSIKPKIPLSKLKHYCYVVWQTFFLFPVVFLLIVYLVVNIFVCLSIINLSFFLLNCFAPMDSLSLLHFNCNYRCKNVTKGDITFFRKNQIIIFKRPRNQILIFPTVGAGSSYKVRICNTSTDL